MKNWQQYPIIMVEDKKDHSDGSEQAHHRSKAFLLNIPRDIRNRNARLYNLVAKATKIKKRS